jgi:hypothetical protein
MSIPHPTQSGGESAGSFTNIQSIHFILFDLNQQKHGNHRELHHPRIHRNDDHIPNYSFQKVGRSLVAFNDLQLFQSQVKNETQVPRKYPFSLELSG